MLRLAPPAREHYLGFVGGCFPDLPPRYERAYRGTGICPAYLAASGRRVEHVCMRHGFA